VAGAEDLFPCVGLVVSGGHSSLYCCESATSFNLLGGTIDDAAGEAFDKVAALLGLPYPGGPSIEHAAAGGNAKRYSFPRVFFNEQEKLALSFSGLKTAGRYAIPPPGTDERVAKPLTPQKIADLAASFQEAVVDCLVTKALAAVELTGLKTL